MPTSGSSSGNEQVITPQLRAILEGKITARRRELDKWTVSRKTEIHQALARRIKERIRKRDQRPGRLRIFLATFQETTDLAVELTEKWPKIVLGTILQTIESITLSPASAGDLKRLLEQFTWTDPSDAFTLDLIDTKRMESTMDNILGRYGLPKCQAETHFERQRDLEATCAQITVLEAAGSSKICAELALDEFFLKEAGAIGPAPSPNGTQPTRDDDGRCNVEECFPSLPMDRNRLWVAVICEATGEFIKEFGRCPNHSELWSRLCEKPPKSYSIESKQDRGGEAAIWSGDQSLGRKAFQQRFRQYKKPRMQQ